MPMSLTMYGKTHCGDTDRTRKALHELHIPFQEVNIDHDASAEQFVISINGGLRSTPTLVFGEGKYKIIVTEPSDDSLKQILAQEWYLNPGQIKANEEYA